MIRRTLSSVALTGLLLTQLGIANDCGGSGEEGVTWYKDIQPITQQSCVGCHRDGGIAPFSMETYEQAAPFALGMSAAVQTGYMPPWPPSSECQTFQDARTLTQAQIDAFAAWSAAGAPEGDPADAQDVPVPDPGLSWTDVVVDTGVDYTPSGTYVDEYRCFVLDPQLTADQHLIGYEVRPGYDPEVHHVLLYAVDPAEARAQDDAEAGPGWTCFGGPGTSNPQMVGGWAPGMPAVRFPEDTGLPLAQGKVLIMQVHYNLSNGVAPDRTEVALQYAHGAVAKSGQFYLTADSDFRIPANALNYSSSSSITVSGPVNVWGLMPHMHQLGRQITVGYKRAGTETCLIDIPKWDFHWQQLYFYENPISLQKGDVVTLTCTWSNTTDQPVTWGEGTSDEMCLSYSYITF